jgi:hypothetical protein
MLSILLAAAGYKGNRVAMFQKMIDTKYCVCCLNLVMDFSLLSLFDASFSYHCKHSRTHTHAQAHSIKPFHIGRRMNCALNNLVRKIVTLEVYGEEICFDVHIRYYGQYVGIILK